MTINPASSGFSLASPEEVLAYIPHALGFYPRNAVVLLIMQGQGLAATLRVDLPRCENGDEQAVPWTSQMVQLVHKVPGATAVFMALYTGQTPTGEHDALPRHELVSRLASALAQSGVNVRDAWYVGANRWHSYFCASVDCCPAEGFDLPDLALTETHLRMVVAGSAPADEIWDGSGVADWPTRDSVREQAGILLQECAGQTPRETLVRDWAELISADPAAAERRIRGDDTFCASLMVSLHDRMVRDILPYLAGRGEVRAVEALNEVARATDFGPASKDFSDFLLGTSKCTPDWERIDRFWYLCRDLLGVASGEERSALLCLLGWINWAKGKGSSALKLFAAVLAKDPEYRLARLMVKLLETGEMPAWVADPQRAWRLRLDGRLSA